MKVVDPGHKYLLRSLDAEGNQELVFVKRIGPNYPGNEAPPYPGTTVQEVLRALIDRLEYVNRQSPCRETESARGHMMAALTLLEERVRRVRDQPPLPSQDVMALPICGACGHVACLMHEVPLT